MKKAYSKPQIIFDSFELSQSIASGCEGIALQAENECAVRVELEGIGNIDIFNTTPSPCTTSGPGDHDLVCYHVPSDDNNVFSS